VIPRSTLCRNRVAYVRLARYDKGRSSPTPSMPARRTHRSEKLWLFQLKNPMLRSALISSSDPSTRQYVTPDTRAALAALVGLEDEGISSLRARPFQDAGYPDSLRLTWQLSPLYLSRKRSGPAYIHKVPNVDQPAEITKLSIPSPFPQPHFQAVLRLFSSRKFRINLSWNCIPLWTQSAFSSSTT